MKGKIYYLVIIALIFSACSLFQSDSYSGEWKITFGGDLERDVEFLVEEDNSFDFGIEIPAQGRTFHIGYKGKIGEDGELEAGIYLDNENVGDVSGKCDYEKGEGTWRGGEYKGTWNAVKL